MSSPPLRLSGRAVVLEAAQATFLLSEQALPPYLTDMAEADIGALRLVYEAISRGDWDAVFRDVHPDFELKTPDRGPVTETYRGREQTAGAFEDFFGPFDEVVAEPQEFFERGDRVVVFFLLRSGPRGSSAVVEIRAGHLWTMRDGKAVRCEIFPEREKALEAAGLSEHAS